jgi:hypothetical protein
VEPPERLPAHHRVLGPARIRARRLRRHRAEGVQSAVQALDPGQELLDDLDRRQCLARDRIRQPRC